MASPGTRTVPVFTVEKSVASDRPADDRTCRRALSPIRLRVAPGRANGTVLSPAGVTSEPPRLRGSGPGRAPGPARARPGTAAKFWP
eukprot:758432-Hanusia_phi.AAC.2